MGSNNHRIFQNTDEDELENSPDSESSSAFYSTENIYSYELVRQRLKSLPKYGTGSGFDQRISAMFALELEEEIRRKTYSLHLRGRSIRLPDMIADLRKEFL